MNHEFADLAHHKLNYLTWASNVDIVLEAKHIKGALSVGTRTTPNTTTLEQNSEALYFLLHHMCSTLKMSTWHVSLWAILKACSLC
jgi:hypothetical protein